MKKNRKKVETYRFNGHPFLDSKSTHPVKIADLQLLIKQFEAKLADPNDIDDKRWTARWLKRYQKELAKKLKGLVLKSRDQRKRNSTFA